MQVSRIGARSPAILIGNAGKATRFAACHDINLTITAGLGDGFLRPDTRVHVVRRRLVAQQVQWNGRELAGRTTLHEEYGVII